MSSRSPVRARRLILAILALIALLPLAAAAQQTNILPRQNIATRLYGNDAPWYIQNIPFFDCSDPEITQVYYYRWQLWKSHIKDLGADHGYILTEFLDDVSWSIHPSQSLNDATAFHIHEGRWVRDANYIDDYIRFMYTAGGNDRHFSESIADAVYSAFLVNSDTNTVTHYLPDMERIYNAWHDHYDDSKGLYFIEPLLDATEFTISSIDASGGKWGFTGGQAFRPTINSFMYADAQAISKIASLSGNDAKAKTYADKAADVKNHLQTDLWNDTFNHFTDRYKVNNEFVHYWDFIRGREIAGYVPWAFNMPDDNAKYAQSWSRLLAKDGFAGAGGIRTVEPSYQYYMRQYIYEPNTNPRKPECQWNGPTWPFDTTLILGAVANLLDHYTQNIIHVDDYVSLLRQYAHQHYMGGNLDIQEDYNPDTGSVIVGLARSHHYNHSAFCDLIITGLAGLHPRADNTLEVNPLISPAIQYLCLENVAYHGHLITILYDKTGKRYGKGAGLSVFVDGKTVVAQSALQKKTVTLTPAPGAATPAHPSDLAVNIDKGNSFPAPSASVNSDPRDLYQAIDGRVWYWPNVRNYWSTGNGSSPATNASDWYALDFGSSHEFHSAKVYFYADAEGHYKAPGKYTLQAWNGNDWSDIATTKIPATPLANGENTITFQPVNTSKLRLLFNNQMNAATALVELKVF